MCIAARSDNARCKMCGGTFVSTIHIVFYRWCLPKDTIVKTITLLAHGCSRRAIVVTFEVDECSVKSLEKSAGITVSICTSI